MNINEFSQKLTDLINESVKDGVPVPYIAMALDMTKFELQGKHLEMVNKAAKAQEAAASKGN